MLTELNQHRGKKAEKQLCCSKPSQTISTAIKTVDDIPENYTKP